MLCKRALAVLLIALMAYPSWSAPPSSIGTVTSGHDAVVQGRAVVAGTTVFDGDTVTVREKGSATIALGQGAQVEVARNSQVSLTVDEGNYRMLIRSGQARFRTTETATLEVRLYDAVVRATEGKPAVGAVSIRNNKSVLVLAERGTLEIRTAHDEKSAMVKEGEYAELEMIPYPQPQAPAGRGGIGRYVLLITAVAAASGAIIAYFVNRAEPNHTDQEKCNEVSPFQPCP